MLKDFPTRAVKIVGRTAVPGLAETRLDDAKFEKWLLVWACDISGELGELIEAPLEDKLVECGDVIWGITALCLLLDIPPDSVLCGNLSPQGWASQRLSGALMKSLSLLDHCKKVTRDGRSIRPVDLPLVAKHLSGIFLTLAQHFDMEEALDAVNQKLLKRYPDGYTPEASVNRTV